MQDLTKSIKFRMTLDDYIFFENNKNILTQLHASKFNQSRFFRLCALKVKDRFFLEYIGYISSREELSDILFLKK